MINSAALLAEARGDSQNVFSPIHIRPSGVGSCLREQFYRILNAAYPEKIEFQPSNPEGKTALEGVAQLGHIIENALADLWAKKYSGKTYRQYSLAHPSLKNLDGTAVTAHTDIWVPSLKTDIEVKSVSISAKYRLPIKNHVDQLLLRLLWWRKLKNRVVTGEIPYIFRETFYDPETGKVPVFKFLPEEEGYLCENTGKLYSWEYIKSFEERLFSLRNSLETLNPPEREGSLHGFPCQVTTPNYSTECPWREKCWKLEEERAPGFMVKAAEELILRLIKAKENQKTAEALAKAAKEEVQVIQKELDFFFDEFGPKISGGGYTVVRTSVDMSEKVIPAYSYYRYSIKRTSQ